MNKSQKDILSVRIRCTARIALYVVLGGIIGELFLHPVALLTRAAGENYPLGVFEAVRMAISWPHRIMALYFILLGGAMGAANALYHERITAQKALLGALEEMLPICASCKRIRDDAGLTGAVGRWAPVADYISLRTSVEFTHGICPDCAQKLYPEYADKAGDKRAG
jgi:hypothetical protein